MGGVMGGEGEQPPIAFSAEERGVPKGKTDVKKKNECMKLIANPPTPWPNWKAPVSTRKLAGHHHKNAITLVYPARQRTEGGGPCS